MEQLIVTPLRHSLALLAKLDLSDEEKFFLTQNKFSKDGATTISIITLSIKILSIMALSITTFSIIVNKMRHSA
jgi:hypothetical protein